MSEIRVTNVIGENGSSPVNFTQGINMSGICTAPAFIPSQGQLSHRNVLINGAMQVAQRGSSSTTHPAYGVDRWRWGFGNHSAGTVTASQQSLSSSDTGPWEKGFRNYTRLALGQAGTAAANTYISMRYKAEAQDIANSGWNYNSASSNITISFWFRCSTNQTFYFEVKSEDGTAQSYVFSFTASGNNTWTKITKTIPGNSNIQIDNNSGSGLALWIYQFYGTDYTNNKTLDQWAAYSGSNVMPDMATTWLTAGASTWDLTGIQLEVGSVATPFEHRSIGEELARCQRYFYKWVSSQAYSNMCLAYAGSSTQVETVFNLPVVMRSSPSFSYSGQFRFVGYTPQNVKNLSNLVVHRSHPLTPYLRGTVSGSASGLVGELGDSGSNDAAALFSAEL